MKCRNCGSEEPQMKLIFRREENDRLTEIFKCEKCGAGWECSYEEVFKRYLPPKGESYER
jgi:uncharacterized Zn finger protein